MYTRGVLAFDPNDLDRKAVWHHQVEGRSIISVNNASGFLLFVTDPSHGISSNEV